MSSRPPRTRPTSAPSSPRPPIPGASRSRPPRPIPAGPTGRCSPVTATRRSPVFSPTATGPAPARWSRFLFDRAQQPDGSFPRDSELDGCVAPDTFGLSEIDEVAYPLLMAWEAGFAGDVASTPTTSGRPPTTSSITAPLRRRALGGAPGLFSVDPRLRDRRARRRVPPGPDRRRQRAGQPLPGDRRRLPAQRQGVDGDHHRPLRQPRYFIRLSADRQPQTDETYNLGTAASRTSTSARSSTPAFSS